MTTETQTTIRFNDILVHLLQLRVWLGTKEVHFTQNELRVLLIFLQEPYRAISSDELVRRADLTNTSALWGLISRLRCLLDQHYIHTVNGGYAFAQNGRLRVTEDE
jgi:DNA-binding response OmpR family regulator